MNRCKIRGVVVKNKETGALFDVFKADYVDKKTGDIKEFKNYSFQVKDENQFYRCKMSTEPDIEILSSDEIVLQAEYTSKYDKDKKMSYTHFEVLEMKKSSF